MQNFKMQNWCKKNKCILKWQMQSIIKLRQKRGGLGGGDVLWHWRVEKEWIMWGRSHDLNRDNLVLKAMEEVRVESGGWDTRSRRKKSGTMMMMRRRRKDKKGTGGNLCDLKSCSNKTTEELLSSELLLSAKFLFSRNSSRICAIVLHLIDCMLLQNSLILPLFTTYICIYLYIFVFGEIIIATLYYLTFFILAICCDWVLSKRNSTAVSLSEHHLTHSFIHSRTHSLKMLLLLLETQ